MKFQKLIYKIWISKAMVYSMLEEGQKRIYADGVACLVCATSVMRRT